MNARMAYIRAELGNALGGASRLGSISPIEVDKPGTDATAKFLVHDTLDRRAAVLLCSPPVSPGLVARGMERARQAKRALGPKLGRVILDPLIEGKVDGLSYAALPYCPPFSGSTWMWRWQRLTLRPALFRWLRESMRATSATPENAKVEELFALPLEHLAKMTGVTAAVRAAAAQARARVDGNSFVPRQVLMHGDLWKGNLLLDGRATNGWLRAPVHHRFVVIDWPGSTLAGYPIYDLVILAESMGLSGRWLRDELDIHARILGFDAMDSRTHLLAALGHIGRHLEHFPIERFAQVAGDCLDMLVAVGR